MATVTARLAAVFLIIISAALRGDLERV